MGWVGRPQTCILPAGSSLIMTNKVAILFPAGDGEGGPVALTETRFAQVADALVAAGMEAVAAPYADTACETVRAQLMACGAVLVWVNPIEGGRSRAKLNAMLADVAGRGVFVSAHPDVIARLGTKEILYETRSMAWGCDTAFYRSLEQLCDELPARLARAGARVLKQVRGNGGDGVWKVAPDPATALSVLVRHAKRGSVEERMDLDALFALMAPYFDAGGGMIDQSYQPRLGDGMIRCYMVHDRVEGFGEQLVNALHPTEFTPGVRLYYPPTRPDFQPLKRRLEDEWLPELCRRLGIDRLELPIIWDADFMYGAKDAAGADSFVLCEINVSSVYPFPESALEPLAQATRDRLSAAALNRR
jgi:hypothetical protein